MSEVTEYVPLPLHTTGFGSAVTEPLFVSVIVITTESHGDVHVHVTG